MERRDKVFTISFIAVLAVLIYFLGASITGYVTESMYCSGGVCNKYCRADSDCYDADICCQKGTFGICSALDACKERYLFRAALDGNIILDTNANKEQPYRVAGAKVVYMSVLTMVVGLIGVLYLVSTHSKDEE
jgi:hypothetical protein